MDKKFIQERINHLENILKHRKKNKKTQSVQFGLMSENEIKKEIEVLKSELN